MTGGTCKDGILYIQSQSQIDICESLISVRKSGVAAHAFDTDKRIKSTTRFSSLTLKNMMGFELQTGPDPS